MISIKYTPQFLRQFKKLDLKLQEEAFDKISIFEIEPSHPHLKAHKLQGKLKNRWSFSINYKTRLVFQYLNDDRNQAVFLAIGDHDVYKT